MRGSCSRGGWRSDLLFGLVVDYQLLCPAIWSRLDLVYVARVSVLAYPGLLTLTLVGCLIKNRILLNFNNLMLKGTTSERPRAKLKFVMTHRQVEFRAMNTYLTLVSSESSRQAGSGAQYVSEKSKFRLDCRDAFKCAQINA